MEGHEVRLRLRREQKLVPHSRDSDLHAGGVEMAGVVQGIAETDWRYGRVAFRMAKRRIQELEDLHGLSFGVARSLYLSLRIESVANKRVKGAAFSTLSIPSPLLTKS